MRRRIKLRTKILILSFVLVLSSVAVSGGSMIFNISAKFEDELGERSMAIARTIAQMEDIQNAIGTPDGYKLVQPIAERVRLSTNVDYVVLLDMDRIRYSHPSESKLGLKFEGGDEGAAYSEAEYTSKAEGDLGYAIRAFVPIMDQEGMEQIGVAVVGILAPTYRSLLADYQNDLFFSLIWGLFIGLAGSWFLANNVKKQTYQLEPYEIYRLVEERSTIMETLDFGIIATDEKGKINFINKLAKKYTNFKTKNDVQAKNNIQTKDIFNEPWVTSRKYKDTEIINRPISIYETMYLISIYPIFIEKDEYVGDLITLKNRSEVRQLGEELTGAKGLVDALRAQNHEHMNKMHSIAGLIQLDRTDEALELLIDETSYEETVVQFLRDHIKHYAISGLLLGKRSRGKELGVQLIIDKKSYLSDVVTGFMPGDILSILGNLIDNAMDATLVKETREVRCLIQGTKKFLYISIIDTGYGMTAEEKETAFERGYSTKAIEGRGFGLSIVKELVDANHGEVIITSSTSGTEVEVEVIK